MAKTAVQKARRRARRAAKRAGGAALKARPRQPPPNKSKGKSAKKQRQRVRQASRKGGVRAREGRMNMAFRQAKYGGGMKAVTDGISIMKTIHNASVIEDTFAVRREKVANVNASTAFTVAQNLYLNPGNSVLFPIFSQIAATYEEYRVNELVFSYETEAYAASGSNVSAGKVILATDYNPSNPSFSGDTQMENYYNSDRGAPYCEIVHDVLLGDHALVSDPMKNYYVNTSANTAAPSGDNAKFYDVGLFQLATSGNPTGGAEIGELYVTYSFTMIRPKQQTPLGSNLTSAHIVEGAAGTGAAATPLGTTGGIVKPGSNLNTVVTKTTFTLPNPGRFVVSCVFVGSVAAAYTLTGGANITTLVDEDDGGSGGITTFSAGNSTGCHVFDVSVAGTGAANTVTIGGLTSFAAGASDIFISQVSSGLTFDVSEEDKILDKRIVRLESKLAKFAAFFENHPLSIDQDDVKVFDHVRTPLSSTELGMARTIARRFF
jgi:hypothetical protein